MKAAAAVAAGFALVAVAPSARADPPEPSIPHPRVALLKELADPIRLRTIDRLGQGGATVGELAAAFKMPLPKLSNHLRRLREAGLVQVERTGRHAIYSLTDPGLEALLPVLDRLTGRSVPAAPMPSRPAAAARTCYGHLAGRLGVDLYRALRDRDAVRDLPDGTVELGNDRDETFAKLGVDAGALETKRRRFAFECLDTTEHAPHLAGVLGDAVAASLLRRRWITRGEGRGIVVTPKGRRELRRVLALDV